MVLHICFLRLFVGNGQGKSTIRFQPECVLYYSFENIVAKGEISYNEQFIFLPQFVQVYSIIILLYVNSFHSFLLDAFIVYPLVICCMWEKVNPFPHTTILQ